MASIVKEGNVWRAYVHKKGIRKSARFPTKSAAKDWATKMEVLLADIKKTDVPNRPVRDLLDRYMSEISPKKRGAKWEITRLIAICRQPIADVMLPELSDAHIMKWRDERLKIVSPASLLREWSILSVAFNHAIREWKWLKENPMKGVSKPKEPPPRERRITPDEIERMKFVCGWDDNPATTATQRMCVAFLFAIETAMRAGEIVSLRHEDVDTEKRVAHLRMTKNGTSRNVPLSTRAIGLINFLPKDSDTIFGITSNSLDALFRKYRDKAGISGLHFHDTRHEAITRLAKKLNVLDLARMVGHKKLNQLMTYYNESAEELAKKLD